MGTTLSCLYFHPDGAIMMHVGDSRIYHLHGETFIQITEDHTLYQQKMNRGEESTNSNDRNLLTKAIGTKRIIHPTPYTCDVKEGDTFLLCSDGLTDMVPEEVIAAILTETPFPEEAAAKLVAIANANGGIDNITLIIVHVEDLSR